MTSHPSSIVRGGAALGRTGDGSSTRARFALAARVAVVLTLVGALLGLSVGPASAAPSAAPRVPQAAQLGPIAAVSASCGGGRCTVYLSKAETRALGNGVAPPLPAALPWQLRAAYYALVWGHVWIARQYANRGWCSGFRLSVYPWESQGYFGYAC